MMKQKELKKNQQKPQRIHLRHKKYYKGNRHIVFYGEDDDTYIAGFDTIRDICKFKNLPVTSENTGKISMQLYMALKKDGHVTKMLGSKMYVYLVDMDDDNA